MARDLAIDLGTANTLVYMKGRGIVLNEPSVIALNRQTGEVLATGREAWQMIGRTPGYIVAVRPLRGGAITDFEITQRLIRMLFQRAGISRLQRARVLICVPSAITHVEQRAVLEAARRAGAAQTFLIEQPMAAAIGGAVVGGRIYAVGGQHGDNESGANQSSVHVYTAESGWTPVADLPRPLGHLTASTFEYRGRLMAIGGVTQGAEEVASVIEYDPTSNTWVALPSLPGARQSPVAGASGARKSGMVLPVRRGRARNFTGHSVRRSRRMCSYSPGFCSAMYSRCRTNARGSSVPGLFCEKASASS